MSKSLTWKTEKRTLAQLKPLEKNPFGKVTAEKLEKLKGKLETLGVFEIPTLDQDNNLLTFNKRYHALMLLHGDSYEIDCRIPERNLTEKERKEIIVTSNVHEGSWDLGILDIEYADIDLSDLGLSTKEIQFEESALYGKSLDRFIETITPKPEAHEDDYQPPAEIKTDIVIGDLFEIGNHRLLCGDSTDSDSVAKLMNGEKADMVFTDPPYGIDWNTNYRRFTGGLIPSENYDKVKNDEKEFDPGYFLAMYDNCLFFGANCFSNKLPKGNWIVWDKRFENGEAFLADAEVAWYSGSGAVYIIKETHQGFVSSDVKKFHPTQKPINLIKKIFEQIKAPEFLFDPFLGSGSTMVAAHQLNRKCYGMELEPKYCQVIIDRMKKLDPAMVIKRNGVLME